MNLYDRPPASSVMWVMTDRAALGSRYSSTNRIGPSLRPGRGRDVRIRHRRQLVVVGLSHELQPFQSPLRLVLVDLRHREADVDQHPVPGAEDLVLEETD